MPNKMPSSLEEFVQCMIVHDGSRLGLFTFMRRLTKNEELSTKKIDHWFVTNLAWLLPLCEMSDGTNTYDFPHKRLTLCITIDRTLYYTVLTHDLVYDQLREYFLGNM